MPDGTTAGGQGRPPLEKILARLLDALIRSHGKLDFKLFIKEAKALVRKDQVKELARGAERVRRFYAAMEKRTRH